MISRFTMPLRDHFRPPLATTHPWEGFHSTWATLIAGQLNERLPPDYVAIPLTSRGPMVEIDVSALELASSTSKKSAWADWSPGSPAVSAVLDWSERDLFEIRVIYQREPRLVGAVELISPANKDRPAARQAFAGKCAGYLRAGVGLILIDVVTTRQHSLNRHLLELLELDAVQEAEMEPLYAVAYRTEQEETARLDVWAHRLQIGEGLPTLPLWIAPELPIPVDLEASYQSACKLLRMAQ
jgi:hypothetical protein